MKFKVNMFKKILCVDDDPITLMILKMTMKKCDFTSIVETVADGTEAVRYYEGLLQNPSIEAPELIFLDLNMPRKNGIECLTEIKENKDWKNLPIIIFSTSLDNEIVNNLYQKGATYYIRKPGEFSKLKTVIEKALTIASENNFKQPERANFILQP